MTLNVGKIDAIIRIILALIVAYVGWYYQSWWGLLAIVPLGTGLLKFCPIYPILGWNTRAKKG